MESWREINLKKYLFQYYDLNFNVNFIERKIIYFKVLKKQNGQVSGNNKGDEQES